MVRFFVEARSWDSERPGEILAQTDRLLGGRLPSASFVTAFMGVIADGTLRLSTLRWAIAACHVAVAQADPPLLVAGDLNDRLPALAAQAPSEATLVVFHSAVMAYLDAEARERFRSTMSRLAVERGCQWLSNEGHTVIIQADGSSVVPEMDESRLRGRFLLLHNGKPTAITGPHGQSLEWL